MSTVAAPAPLKLARWLAAMAAEIRAVLCQPTPSLA